MQNNGRQPGLLEQYTHLTGRRQGMRMGSNSGVGRKSAANRVTQGTVRRLMPDRGFGFIQADGYRQDLFFHCTSVQDIAFDELKEGDLVDFEVQRDERRDRTFAINIRPSSRPKQHSAPRAETARGRIFTGWQEVSNGTGGSAYRPRDGASRNSGSSRSGQDR